MKNIIEILNKHSIEFKDRGSGVGSGNVNIKCPFCSNDPSFHMGIKIDGTGYGCWRNFLHRGKRLSYLFAKLLQITEEEASNLLGIKIKFVEEEDYIKALKFIKKDKNKETKVITKLEFPKEFKEIKNSGRTKRFWDYLEGRSFYDVEKLIRKYNFKCCLLDEYEYRIIIPIYFKNKLVTWTGRTIKEDEKIRYKNLSLEKSIIKITDMLFNWDVINKGGEILFICEGPFDALNLQQYFTGFNKSTCLFTKNVSSAQLSLFYELKNKYKKFIILLDKGENTASLQVAHALSFLKNVEIYFLQEAKDPGNLTKEQIVKLLWRENGDTRNY